MVESLSSFIIEIWMRMIQVMMMILMMITMILMVIMMTKPNDYDDDTDDDNDQKNDSYTAAGAGAAPGASVSCSLFLALWSRPFGPGPGYSRKPLRRLNAAPEDCSDPPGPPRGQGKTLLSEN